MALKITTVTNRDIIDNKRFEPRFFCNRNYLDNTFNRFKYKTINDIATIYSGSTPEHSDEKIKATDKFFIKAADIKRYSLNTSTISFTSEEIYKSRLEKTVLCDDVLISNTGKYLGFACVIPNDIKESTTNQNITCIRLFDKSCSPSFLMAYLNSYLGQYEINSLLTLTGQKYLNSTNLKKLKVPIVDNDFLIYITNTIELIKDCEQKAITNIHKAQEVFYKALNIDFSKIRKEKFFSVKKSFFTEEDLWMPKYSYPLYVNTVEAIKEKYKTVRLSEIAKVSKGDEVGSENYIQYIDKKENDVPFIRTTDIVNYETDLYPDFFIAQEIYKQLNQDLKAGDVLFTKDGKIGMVGMITKNDKVIVASGFAIIRLLDKAKKYNITSEYLFLVLSIKEIGTYASKRRTVIASTIPHLREERLKEFEIPVLDKNTIDEITTLVKQAFDLKDKRKQLIKQVRQKMDAYFEAGG